MHADDFSRQMHWCRWMGTRPVLRWVHGNIPCQHVMLAQVYQRCDYDLDGWSFLHQFMKELDRNYNLKFTMSYNEKKDTIPGSMDQEKWSKENFHYTLSQEHCWKYYFTCRQLPSTAFNSIPYTQYLRPRRNWSSADKFKIEALALKERLVLRGYSNKLLKKAYKKAQIQDRNDILHKKKEAKESNSHTRIITRYNVEYRSVQSILERYWYTWR